MRCLILVLLVLLGSRTAVAQVGGQLQILNTAINLGWVSGIIQSEGTAVLNVDEIGPALANANAALRVFRGAVASPPYSREGFSNAIDLIDDLALRIGGMPRQEALREIERIRQVVLQSLRVYLSAQTSRLEISSTCDSAVFRVGFYFGQGQTAIQRGNVELERQARGQVRQAIGVGKGAAELLMCPFADYLGLPMMRAGTAASYGVSLPILQTLTFGGPLPPGTPPLVAPVPGVATPLPTPPTTPTLGCADLTGVWAWFTNGDVTIDADGTLNQGSRSATWTCQGGTVRVTWSHGFTDRMTLSSDGSELRGVGWATASPSRTHVVWGQRRISPTGSCASLPGRWNWFANGEVVINADGTLRQGPRSAAWTCQGGTVRITWSHGFADRITLSSDGRGLRGVGWPTADPSTTHEVWGRRRP